jgi:hypothetical protein
MTNLDPCLVADGSQELKEPTGGQNNPMHDELIDDFEPVVGVPLHKALERRPLLI